MRRADRVAVATVIALAAEGCSGAGGGRTPGTSGTQAPPESTLCELSIGSSTVGDAFDVLGPYETPFSSGDRETIAYSYGASGFINSSIVFVVDENQVLADAFATGLQLPGCWRTEIAALRGEADDV